MLNYMYIYIHGLLFYDYNKLKEVYISEYIYVFCSFNLEYKDICILCTKTSTSLIIPLP